MDIDVEPLETNVYIHSPLLEYSDKGGYYTTYAIHLMTNNPAFNYTASHTRRRYSEFVSLRNLLTYHYPTIKPPNLPPKSFFQRFANQFIEERMKGLQAFLKAVLATSVYLSDKSLHLFLQSSCTMEKISEECLGDIPAPPLIIPQDVNSSHSETSSEISSDYKEIKQLVKPIHNLVLEDIQTSIKTSSRSSTNDICSKYRPPLSSSLQIYEKTKQFVVPKKSGSVESSPSSSSSLESNYSSIKVSNKDRKVSFNERVQIAVVTNYGICVLTP